MDKTLHGGCLCGKVTFALNNNFKKFYFCHCKQCQQLTGSAFAANLFTSPDNLQWLSGDTDIQRYEHPARDFSKAFCCHCGSALPIVTKNGRALLVPAGSITGEPSLMPQANIFRGEEACWLAAGTEAESVEAFP
tara:strand:+ start:120 stop:524 length:405 start_codon:yes stop_codon:yes gene_type:complete